MGKTFVTNSSSSTFLCLNLEFKVVFIHKLSELESLQKFLVCCGQMPTCLSFGTIKGRAQN